MRERNAAIVLAEVSYANDCKVAGIDPDDLWEGNTQVSSAYYEAALADIAALVVAGWKLVPMKMTEAMKDRVRKRGGPQALAYALAAWPDLLDAADVGGGDG